MVVEIKPAFLKIRLLSSTMLVEMKPAFMKIRLLSSTRRQLNEKYGS